MTYGQTDIRIAAKPSTTDYLLTASIPWTSLGIKPQTGQSLIADLGLLFSDDTGAPTAQRIHWVDPETNVINDTPTEVEFAPARWGTWELLGADGKKVSRKEPAPAPDKAMASKSGTPIPASRQVPM